MRIVIINILIFTILVLLLEFTVRISKISSLQGVEKNLLNFSNEIILNRANNETIVFGKKAFIDKNGFRVPVRNYKYKYRSSLLILGDSVSFGVGVDEDKTFPGILRKNLKVNIYNASVVGHNIIDYSFLIKNYHKNFDNLSRVIIMISLNDAHLSKGIIHNKELKNESYFIRTLKHINIFLRNKSALFVLLKSKFTKADERHFNLLSSYYNDQEVLNKYKNTLKKIDQFSKSKNLKVNYILLPYSFQIQQNCNNDVLFPQQIIKNIFYELKMDVNDFTKDFCIKNEKKLYLNYDPVHLSEKGHTFVYNLIVEKVF